MMHLVVRIFLGPVAHELEPANDLTDRKEANDLSSDNTGRYPLLSRQVPDLGEEVGGLLGGVVGLGGGAVQEGAGVLEGVEGGLHVALHCLDRWWCHGALVCNELAELETDF